MSHTSDVVVVGAGVIGAATAWRCVQRGLSVTMVDPELQRPRSSPRGAWHTAAGMLAPITELTFTETPLLRLNLASLRRYSQFTQELAEVARRPTGYWECGTVEVAWDAADLTTLHDLAEFGARLGLASRLLTGRELRHVEPSLAAGLPGGLRADSDHQVDPRLLHAALISAAHRVGVQTVATTATLDVHDGRAVGVTLADGTRLAAGTVVLAGGAWSGTTPGADRLNLPPVRPVKGQVLRLRLPGQSRLGHVVRGRVKGSPIYVLPRRDGEYVVGASMEEAGFDTTPRAGAVYELLRDAISLVPELSEATLDEVCTGLRPGSPDNAPLIGPTAVLGLVVATGHFRNGILLTPVTADVIAEIVATGTVPDVVAPFLPTRFGSAPDDAPAQSSPHTMTSR